MLIYSKMQRERKHISFFVINMKRINVMYIRAGFPRLVFVKEL